MIFDIYYALLEYYDGSVKDVLGSMQELLDDINSEKFKGSFEDYLYDKAISNEICPHCIKDLNTRSIIVNTHEYMGKEVDEIQAILYCSNCKEEF